MKDEKIIINDYLTLNNYKNLGIFGKTQRFLIYSLNDEIRSIKIEDVFEYMKKHYRTEKLKNILNKKKN